MPVFRPIKKHPILTLVLVVAIVGGSVMLLGDRTGAQADLPAAAPQAVPVVTQVVNAQDVRVWSEFSGKLVAVDAAQIRPEVSGRITEIRFTDGQQVKKGDIIYVIDPRPFEADVAKAEANLASARTNASFAKTEMDRAEGLIKTKAIAQRIYDERATASKVASANVQSAEAELKQAKLDLEHAYVRAPISGKISRAEITVGNLVQAGANAPLLTTIVANDEVYADFDVDENTYVQAIRAQQQAGETESAIPVTLSLRGDDSEYRGTLQSFDNRIDERSGTIRARAKFDNEDGGLIPGMFASVSMVTNTQPGALLVPERAIGTDQNKKYVYVVSDGNKVAYREVTLGASVEGGRIVTSGISAGEQVIVDGVQHVHPDSVVTPTPASAPDNAA